MIELAVGPGDGIVAVCARRGKFGAQVIDRRFRVVVVSLMTGNAIGIGDVVVVVDVAIRALAGRNLVRTSERKSSFCVIETRGLPG